MIVPVNHHRGNDRPGKSTLARALAEALGWEWLRPMFSVKNCPSSFLEHRFEEFHQGIYSPEFSQKTYQKLFERARDNLESEDRPSSTPLQEASGPAEIPRTGSKIPSRFPLH